MSSYKNLEALVEKYVHKYEALSLVLESVQQERDEYRDLYSSSQEKLEAAERERDELRAEQAEHDEQIARMESKFSLAKRALDSKTARCDKAEAELRRRDAAAGEPAVLPELEQDVKNIIGLLSENEWAEHCTKSELGRKLEGEITRLHDLREPPQKVVALPDHKFRECVNGLLEEAISYAGTQQLRARLSTRLSNFVKPQHAENVKREVKP